MGIPLRIAEFTGRWRRDLRRYGGACPAGSCCNATVAIDEIDGEDAAAHGDNWPHDDLRWPTRCEACGREFDETDHWQRNDNRIYRLPDGTEFAMWGDVGRQAPAGTMIRAEWYDDFSGRPGESWLVVLPDGGTWITTSEATGGGYWTVEGEPPNLTVSPSIFHNAPHGWHGFIRAGELIPA